MHPVGHERIVVAEGVAKPSRSLSQSRSMYRYGSIWGFLHIPRHAVRRMTGDMQKSLKPGLRRKLP